MAIYMNRDLKYKEVVRQATIMLLYANGETIAWESFNNKGTCNIEDFGAGLVWDWSTIEYSVAGDENYE